MYFMWGSKKDQNMDMWKTPFLKFNCVDMANDFTKHAILNLLLKGLFLLLKNPCNNVWVVFRLLLSRFITSYQFKQSFMNLWPLGICSHGNEKIWLSTISADS